MHRPGLRRHPSSIGDDVNSKFDPDAQYVQYSGPFTELGAARAMEIKEAMKVEMESFVPKKYRNRVVWLIIPSVGYGAPWTRGGFVCWKYQPRTD